LLCIAAKLIVEWQRWVVKSGGDDRDNPARHVRFAPKATVGHQDAIRRFVLPKGDIRIATAKHYSITWSALACNVSGTFRPSALGH
jgi:hypothetical protein